MECGSRERLSEGYGAEHSTFNAQYPEEQGKENEESVMGVFLVMFAYTDYRTPWFFDFESILLLACGSILAFFASPIAKVDPETRNRFELLLPPIMFLYWVLFHSLFLHPHIDAVGYHAWLTNAAICFAFGIAFSFRLLRKKRCLERVEGWIFLVVFCCLILTRYKVHLAFTTSLRTCPLRSTVMGCNRRGRSVVIRLGFWTSGH